MPGVPRLYRQRGFRLALRGQRQKAAGRRREGAGVSPLGRAICTESGGQFYARALKTPTVTSRTVVGAAPDDGCARSNGLARDGRYSLIVKPLNTGCLRRDVLKTTINIA